MAGHITQGWLVRASVDGTEDDPSAPDLVGLIADRVESTGATGVLIDLSHRRRTSTRPETRAVVERIARSAGFRRSALAVVAPRPALYGMARLIGAHLESTGIPFEVFADQGAAFSWLLARTAENRRNERYPALTRRSAAG